MRPAGGLLPFQHSEGENRAERLPFRAKEAAAAYIRPERGSKDEARRIAANIAKLLKPRRIGAVLKGARA
jgi:hypothetical protein